MHRPAGVSKNSFVPSGDFLNGPMPQQLPKMRDPVRQSMPEMGSYLQKRLQQNGYKQEVEIAEIEKSNPNLIKFNN